MARIGSLTWLVLPRTKLLLVGVQWLPWESDETCGSYVSRAAAQAKLGLVLAVALDCG